MKVVIVGAGFAGVTTAKVLRDLGHACIVFEKSAHVGGVWAPSRWYPGMQMQNTKDSYCFSDMPMPADYPEWPSARQVHAYFEDYVDKSHLRSLIHLNEEVVAVTESSSGDYADRWIVATSSGRRVEADHVVICSGIFSRAHVPSHPGIDEFRALGGRVYHTSELGRMDLVAGRDVLVVGYGRSACDVAHAVSECGGARNTTVVARNVGWKLPRRIQGVNYKWLMLTRTGEALFEHSRPTTVPERFLHRTPVGTRIRDAVLEGLESAVRRQLSLESVGLVPDAPFKNLAGATLGLSTEGFFQKVKDGVIRVRRNAAVSRLGVDKQGRTGAYLGSTDGDGDFVPASVVVCGTGWTQEPPAFLPESTRSLLTDDRGGWLLYRQVKPLQVDGLSFNGRGSSLFSTLSVQAGALWIGAFLARGEAMLPSKGEQWRCVRERLERQRLGNPQGAGGAVMPVSLNSIDQLLAEAGVNVGRLRRLKQWVAPVNPTHYRGLAARLAARLQGGGGDRDFEDTGVVDKHRLDSDAATESG